MSTKELPNFEYLKAKYEDLAKTEGLSKAISALHNYIGELEPRVFDGGFNQDKFEILQKLRELSRNLWTQRLTSESRTAT